jgi:hypothetical protein
MATYVETLISRITTDLTQPIRRDMSTETLNRRNELEVKLLARLEQFAAKKKSIWDNRTLSDQGKQQQEGKQADELLPDLAWIGRVLTALEKEQAQRKAVLFTVEPTVKDDVLRHLRARELRDRMAGLNQAERDVAYLRLHSRISPKSCSHSRTRPEAVGSRRMPSNEGMSNGPSISSRSCMKVTGKTRSSMNTSTASRNTSRCG